MRSHFDIRLVAAWLVAVFVSACSATGAPLVPDPEPLTVFVVVDDASSATLGAFPLDRSVYAHAASKAREMGAKGLVLKFFFGAPSNEASDRAITEEMSRIPTLMEVFPGRQRDGLPPNLTRLDWSLSGLAEPLQLGGIAMPMQDFAKQSRELGFVEARPYELDRKIDVAALVGHVAIGSLHVAALELALGQKASLSDHQLRFGMRAMPLDDKGRVTCDVMDTQPRAFGVDDLLRGAIPEGAIRGKVVVLGYGRADSPTVTVAGNKLPIHRVFYMQLACIARLFN